MSDLYNWILNDLRNDRFDMATKNLETFIEKAKDQLFIRGWFKFPLTNNEELNKLIIQTDEFLTGPRERL